MIIFHTVEQGAIDSSLPLLDYRARMYDPVIARWMSVDPLAEKYYSITPYGYCAGNPVNVVDPNGLDIWEIDEQGRIVSRTSDTTTDSFYMVKKSDDGSYQRTGESLSFSYGTVITQRSVTYSPRQITNNQSDPVVDEYDIYEIRGDGNGQELFEFFAENITAVNGIEFGHVKTGIEGDQGLNFVTSSHYVPTKDLSGKKLYAHELGIPLLYNGQLRFGYTIREIIHSHKSIKGPSEDDKDFAKSMTKNHTDYGLHVPLFKIYEVQKKSYLTF